MLFGLEKTMSLNQKLKMLDFKDLQLRTFRNHAKHNNQFSKPNPATVLRFFIYLL